MGIYGVPEAGVVARSPPISERAKDLVNKSYLMYNILYKIQNFEAKGKIICSRRQNRDTVF